MRFFSKTKELFESFFKKLINQKLGTTTKKLSDAIVYSLFSGGKRLRPVLLLECAASFKQGSSEAVLPLAAALECVHSYSLIHDDLPAMDNDDFRRGKPTNHKVFGEATAILAGDALLNLAYEIMFDAAEKADDKGLYLKACQIIAQKAGVLGIINGQVLDINFDNNINENDVLQIYNQKTGSLFEAAALSGIIALGADQKTQDCFKQFANGLGICFQLADDISDENDKSLSFVRLFGKDRALAHFHSNYDKSLAALENLDFDSANLKYFLELIKDSLFVCPR